MRSSSVSPENQKSSADLPFEAGDTRGSVPAIVEMMKPLMSMPSALAKASRNSADFLKISSDAAGLGSLYE